AYSTGRTPEGDRPCCRRRIRIRLPATIRDRYTANRRRGGTASVQGPDSCRATDRRARGRWTRAALNRFPADGTVGIDCGAVVLRIPRGTNPPSFGFTGALESGVRGAHRNGISAHCRLRPPTPAETSISRGRYLRC